MVGGQQSRCTQMPSVGSDGVVAGDLHGWNAWLCYPNVIVPARLVIESLDDDAFTRSVVPVALQSSIRLTGLRPQPRLRRALITQVGGSSVAEGETWAGEIW